MKKKELNVEEEIQRNLRMMGDLSPLGTAYKVCSENLTVLYELRAKKKARFIEPEAFVSAVTNLGGILLILRYEEFGVIASKALGFVLKRL